jgi:BASS family bile acid:Na+ symporter
MKNAMLMIAMVVGVVFPQGHILTPIVAWTLAVMLFFAFLDINLKEKALHISHAWVLGLNLVIGIFFYLILLPFSPTAALIACLIGITPTAAAAPVIVNYLGGKVGYVTVAVVLTNCGVALVLPFLLPVIASGVGDLQLNELLAPVLAEIFIPLALALAIKRWSPRTEVFLQKIKDTAYYLFILNIYIASAKATDFIMEESGHSMAMILAAAFFSLLICVLNFWLGHWVGRPDFAEEASQSLGRKNTMFTIWVALTYISPLAALGPMFYILWHNSYNTYQMAMHQRKKKQKWVSV